MINPFRAFRNALRAYQPKPAPGPRTFAGARLTRYVQFQTLLEAAHKERQRDLVALRAHARDLAQNNVYGRRYSQLIATHVVGPDGITLESEIMGNGGRPKIAWNDEIERQWAAWGQAVTVDGRLSWVDFTQLVAKTVAVDGECLIRIHRGFPHNKFGIALELIDADRLDWTWDQPMDREGNRTAMGIQLDRWNRRTGYYIWSAHPADYQGAPQRVLVPASEILHIYDEDRANSVRGISWMTPVMVQMSMLGRLWTSELEAANADADRIAIVKAPPPDPDAEQRDEDGNPRVTFDPLGMADELQQGFGNENLRVLGIDPGLDITFPASNHPTPGLDLFARQLLKGIASGLGVAYHSLSSDLSESKYSSDRSAMIQERDHWRLKQGWFIRQVCEPIYRAWMEMAVLAGVLRFPVSDWTKLVAPTWWPRSWDWVDPLKDGQASVTAINAGLSTYQTELGAQGYNWREVMRQRAAEQQYAKELGLVLDTAQKPPAEKPEPAEEPTTKPESATEDSEEEGDANESE